MKTDKNKIKVGIVGASGYTGFELLRILLSHENISSEIEIFSRNSKNEKISSQFPHLKHSNLHFSNKSILEIAKCCDCVFLALPHGESIQYIKQISQYTKIIDLSADLRLQNEDLHKKYYPNTEFNEYLSQFFTYGFIEKDKNAIIAAKHISNPGCFALCSQLCILPFKNIAKSIDIFAITGSSGGGKVPSTKAHHPSRVNNLFSYNINAHRHMGEIFQSFPNIPFNFIPSSGSFVRGIFANLIIKTRDNINSDIINKMLLNAFHDAKFVRVMEKNIELVNIVASNFFDISYQILDEKTLIIQGVLDNLVKGASGNSIQCMNLMFGFDENAGLKYINPIYP